MSRATLSFNWSLGERRIPEIFVVTRRQVELDVLECSRSLLALIYDVNIGQRNITEIACDSFCDVIIIDADRSKREREKRV